MLYLHRGPIFDCPDQGRIQELRKEGAGWRAQSANLNNGGLGAESPAGSRGRAPVQDVRGCSPP